MVLQPHRCRMSESRSSLVATIVRVAMLTFRVFACCVCFGCGMGWLSGRRFVLLIVCASLMPCAANGGSNVVDIFNVTSGAWSTAALSVARVNLAATSLPNVGVAIFAGGYSTCCHADFSRVCVLCLFWLGNRMVEWAGVGLLFACASLMPCAASSVYSNAVDIFNVTSGAWSTAALSVARSGLAAASLPNVGVAIFAGGSSTCCHADFSCVCVLCLFWLWNGMVEWAGVGLLLACASLMPCAVDGSGSWSNAVDIFNVTSGAWSTAALSIARTELAATSLPDLGVAIFAGGSSTCCHADFSCVCVLCLFWLWNGMVEWAEVRFADCVCKSHALRSKRGLQRCGHLQRDVWSLEHCCSQRSSNWSCSRIAAECRSRDLRWRLEYVLPC
jgi:hypothetical protein